MKLSDKQRRFTLMVARLVEFAFGMGFELTLGHVWRDTETQKRLFDKGLSKTMNSKHCDRLAADLNLFLDGNYMTDREAYRPLGELWEKLGGRWGGRFGVEPGNYDKEVGWDPGHFEYAE